MTTIASLNPADRMLALSLAMLTALTLVVAIEAHAFCQIFCIHGEARLTEICASQAGR